MQTHTLTIFNYKIYHFDIKNFKNTKKHITFVA